MSTTRKTYDVPPEVRAERSARMRAMNAARTPEQTSARNARAARSRAKRIAAMEAELQLLRSAAAVPPIDGNLAP